MTSGLNIDSITEGLDLSINEASWQIVFEPNIHRSSFFIQNLITNTENLIIGVRTADSPSDVVINLIMLRPGESGGESIPSRVVKGQIVCKAASAGTVTIYAHEVS